MELKGLGMAQLPPTFAEIAEALAWQAQYNALSIEQAEVLVATLESLPAPGMAHAWRLMRQRTEALSEAHRLFVAMAPHEAMIRSMLIELS
jgi:hypothetical protein